MVNAPRLQGQHGWYLENQLKKFVSGARGTNKLNIDGLIMKDSLRKLKLTDEMIKDVTAYILTLPNK